MGLRLNRNLGSPATLVQGEFALDAGLTHISCPLCATLGVLDEDRYAVDRAGKVTPAWTCNACPFMEWIELEPLL